MVGATVLAVVTLSTSLPPASPFAAAVLAAPGGNGKGNGNGGSNGNGGNSGAHDNKGKGNGKADAGDDSAGEDESTDENSNTNATTAGGDRSGRDYVADEVVVANLGKAARRDIGNLGFVVLDERPLQSLGLTITRLRVPRQMTAPAARTVLANLYPGILVDLNDVYRPQGQVSLPSPDYPAKLIGWGQPPDACGQGLRIGLLDTAVDGNSPGLRGAHIVQRSFLPANAATASTDHGTAIAAILVGQRFAHGGGLLPGAELAAAGIFGADPDNGAPMADVLALLRGLDWLMGLRALAINMSFTGDANDVLALALKRAVAGHAILVAAAGNGGPTAPPAFPADAPGVIGVTAVDGDSQPYAHANRGDYIAFAAPGVRIWTPGPDGPGSYHTGTSFATPFVTAAVAARVPAGGADVGRVVDSLAATAIDLGPPGNDPIFGRGLIQAANPCSQATQ